MSNMLGHHVNKPVLVAIRSIFQDDTARECILFGVETGGLWLGGEELINCLFPDHSHATPNKVFVPYARITFLAEAIATRPPAYPAPKRKKK